ncbi:isovaleryl-CoA dehydrogenase [Hyphomicrobium sp.]|uniref:isovaleryl-CoA dehydrogenase n=1 Tax=Hyphomicrobium sp. TaxID=82 RepID=UPI002E331F3B|nr:isovaleryl-CoA dehydrogenase [Hyphomicrobium sp.]HEX2842515.1 isovaleryl-CoA dehydrogenase [Hyphomicrobium sp.]
MSERISTHEVLNQPTLFENVNLFTSDVVLRDAVAREGGGHAARDLDSFGALCGSAEALEHGRLANEFSPQLVTHDVQGRRADVVQFHPAYHACMAASMNAGLHSSAWWRLAEAEAEKKKGASVARAAALYMATQMEPGHVCPLTMTNAAVPLLLKLPQFAKTWLPKVLARSYDPRFLPMDEKSSVTFGMGMTEKQGGTDVRSNTTRAVPGGPEGSYLITGHKWFLSAPMSDAFFVLAQAPGGLSCFFMPRFLPDGGTNAIYLQRLKNKLGNRANASAESEFNGACAWLVGQEGRGVAAIIDMVTWTRLDCSVSSAGLMRSALAHAIHHCKGRRVFGKFLIDQPLMRHVLADIALDVEAATQLAFQLARTFDEDDASSEAWRRLMTPVTKYWVCKIAPRAAYEAMECFGGNGYTESFPLARIYREAPVNSIWEGSGNVMALDVVRVFEREPPAAHLVLEGLARAAGGSSACRAVHQRIEVILRDPSNIEAAARELAEQIALLAASVLLRQNSPARISDAFVRTRLSVSPRQTYGQGLEAEEVKALLERATPVGH